MAKKVTVVGAGNVGATCAQRIVEKNLADVVLVDVVEGMPQGKALDIMQSAPVEGFTAKMIGANDYSLTAGSDVVVITAGLARKPGMSRDDLLMKNAEIVEAIARQIIERSPNCIIVMVTNPLDVMSYLVYKKFDRDPKRVVGMAGVLDSARYRYFVSEAVGCAPSEVEALVLGGHGDTMVPVVGLTKVKGKQVEPMIGSDKMKAIVDRTRNGGAEIVSFLKTGSAYYAPSSSAVEMVKAILNDEKKTLPCCAFLDGHYGLKDMYFGVPVVLSKNGVEKIVDVPLTQTETMELERSAANVREQLKKLGLQ